MKINLSPIGTYDELILTKEGDSLWVNGEVFDFSPLLEGATLPTAAIASSWFMGDISRTNGQIELTVFFPHHGPDAPEAARFPTPIIMLEDGNVDLPDVTPEEYVLGEPQEPIPDPEPLIEVTDEH